MDLCGCGCGQQVKKAGRKFLHGHHVRLINPNVKGCTPWNKGNKTRYKFKCGACGKRFQSKLKVAKYCSHECYAESIKGSASHLWKGGKRTKYKMVYVEGLAYYRREHLVLMEKHLGRTLKKKERVHHIDGNGMNNTLSNLHLFHCERCHQHHHHTNAPLTYIYGEAH